MADGKPIHETAQRLEQLFSTNCVRVSETVGSLAKDNSAPGSMGDAADAALTFITAATADNELSNDILGHFDEYRQEITSTFDTEVSKGNGRTVEMLHGIPDTVNPVKAHPAYVQIPNGDKTELKLVWKVSIY